MDFERSSEYLRVVFERRPIGSEERAEAVRLMRRALLDDKTMTWHEKSLLRRQISLNNNPNGQAARIAKGHLPWQRLGR